MRAATSFSDDSVLIIVLLSRVVDEHIQVMVDSGDWATEIGRYPAAASGHSLENLRKSALETLIGLENVRSRTVSSRHPPFTDVFLPL